MIEYYLKVTACDDRHCLTGLSAVNRGGNTLESISLVATAGPIHGDVSQNAATIFVSQRTIDKIHGRVNDQNPNRDVRVRFIVTSMDDVPDFSHSYT